MASRTKAPLGSPCWADLWTSNVESSRRFYSELFGWEAQEANPEFGGYFMFTREGVPVAGAMGDMGDMKATDTWKVYLTTDDITRTQEANPEFGGYFMFTREGVPVAGAMGDMGDMKATDTWKVYLTTDDITRTLRVAESEGATLLSPAMPVADLGTQAVLMDPTGAQVGTWEPGTFPGFTVLGEPGAPSWFELHTRDHASAVGFYRSVFRWETNAVGDTDEFRYTTMRDPEAEEELAGIVDAAAWLPEGVSAHWSIYWETDDAESTVARVKELGGSVIADVEDTPYGRLATAADPTGAMFKLRTG